MDIEHGLAIDWLDFHSMCIVCTLSLSLSRSNLHSHKRCWSDWYQIRSANFRLNSLNFSLASYTFTSPILMRSGLMCVWLLFCFCLFFSYYLGFSVIVASSIVYANNSSSQITFTLCCFWCDMCWLVIWFPRAFGGFFLMYWCCFYFVCSKPLLIALFLTGSVIVAVEMLPTRGFKMLGTKLSAAFF